VRKQNINPTSPASMTVEAGCLTWGVKVITKYHGWVLTEVHTGSLRRVKMKSLAHYTYGGHKIIKKLKSWCKVASLVRVT